MKYKRIYDSEKKELRIETPLEHVGSILTRLEEIAKELQKSPMDTNLCFKCVMLENDYLGIMDILRPEEEVPKKIINLDEKFKKTVKKLNLIYELSKRVN